MPLTNATGQFGHVEETFLNDVLQFIAAGLGDLLDRPSEFRIAHAVGLVRDQDSTLLKALVVRTLLVILKKIDLLGQANHKGVNRVLQIGGIVKNGVKGLAGSSVHTPCIGPCRAGLYEEVDESLEIRLTQGRLPDRSGVEEWHPDDLSTSRLQCQQNFPLTRKINQGALSVCGRKNKGQAQLAA